MTDFAALLPGPKPVIGMIHLPPLPDYPESPGLDAIISSALRDLHLLMEHDFDGVLIENEYDRPHRVRAAPQTIAVMSAVTRAVVTAARGIAVGCEILLNDPMASLAVAKTSGARFIRSDYFVDRMSRPEYGEFEIEPERIISHRSAIGADDVLILADIQVKYATMQENRPLSESARLACVHQADAIVVTGNRSGDPPSVEQIQLAREGVAHSGRSVPVLIGSGLDARNAATLLSVADGAIVGTSLMRDRVVDGNAAKQVMSQVLELRLR